MKIEGPCVAICVPVYDNPKTLFWRSYQNLMKPSSQSPVLKGATHTMDTHGLLIEQARHTMTAAALKAEPKVTHVLMLDSDMTFAPDALARLLARDLPVVGGLCHNRRSPYMPIMARKRPNLEGRPGFIYHYQPGLVEVDFTGAAFLLIRREVLEAVGPVWWDKVGGYSEDFSFCERAREKGFPIYVDTDVPIGHIAEVVVDEEFARKNRPYLWDAWNPDPEIEGKLARGEPLATVVIPVYNQDPKLLRKAIFSAATQSVPVQVVVVDDGSDPLVPADGWPENVEVYRHPENRGIAAALNRGIVEMRTPWFAWLSSDDLWDHRKIERQLAAMAQAKAKCSYTRWQAAVPSEAHTRIAPIYRWRSIAEQMAVLSQGCAVNGSTVMIHQSVLDEAAIGGRWFDSYFKYGQDWDLFARIGEKHLWLPIEEILTTRREHDNLTAAIDAEPADGERRLRRDEEDAMIRETFAVWAK